ncbi:MAG TPA: hypothetical protein VMS93_08500, partial [Candidatus Saccharimonadales bacterium]|nr:hypothetical protein [Candidatus Saccharimonadales bacterium]
LAAAAAAAEFVDRNLVRDGRLVRRWHAGAADILAYQEDFAGLARGRLDLYEATLDPRHLRRALELAREMDRRFRDPAGGAYLFSSPEHEQLLAPHRDLYDGALPSGNSVAAGLLLRLGALTGDPGLAARGAAVLEAAGEAVAEHPAAYTELLQAADFRLGPALEVVVAGEPGDPEVRAMWRAVHETYLPNRVLAAHPPGEAGEAARGLMPWLAAQAARDGRATAYVCRDHACQAPVGTAAELREGLQAARGGVAPPAAGG